MGFFFRPGGGGEAVEEYANYDSIPDGTEGATARTTNNNMTWRYSTVSDCWIPSEFYDSGLAIQKDRSGSPKDLDFKTPQISDFSGLSNYASGGSPSDGTDEIEFSNGDYILFYRETHTGDSLLIVNIDYTQTSGTASYFRQGILINGHTGATDETVNLDFSGTTRNQSNHATCPASGTSVGTNMRPAEGFSFVAGKRIFLRWNSDQQTTNVTPAFITVIGQDQNEVNTLRVLYAGLENISGQPAHRVVIENFGGSSTLKLKRFQILKYT